MYSLAVSYLQHHLLCSDDVHLIRRSVGDHSRFWAKQTASGIEQYPCVRIDKRMASRVSFFILRLDRCPLTWAKLAPSSFTSV